MIGFKIIDPIRKIPISGGASTTTVDGGAAASGLGGASNLPGDFGDKWKSPYLLATERRSLDKRTSRLSSGSSQPGSVRLGGGAGNNGGGTDFDDSWNPAILFASRRGTHSGSGLKSVGRSDPEINSKYSFYNISGIISF